MEIFAVYASLIAQLQHNLINGADKLSFLSVQNSFLYEHLPRDLKHLTVASLFGTDDLEIADCSN